MECLLLSKMVILFNLATPLLASKSHFNLRPQYENYSLFKLWQEHTAEWLDDLLSGIAKISLEEEKKEKPTDAAKEELPRANSDKLHAVLDTSVMLDNLDDLVVLKKSTHVLVAIMPDAGTCEETKSHRRNARGRQEVGTGEGGRREET
jgi:hypothetical protein